MNNSTNSTDETVPIPLSLSGNYQYIGFGATAVLSNFILLALLCIKRDLLMKSAFIFGLAVGDLIDGLALFSAGWLRIVRTYDGSINLLIHPSVCMTQITPLFILGNEIPGIMFLFIGVERFLAIKYFVWYHKKWSDKMSWMMTGVAYVYSTLSLSAAFVITFTQPPEAITSYACGTPSVVGPADIGYNYGIGFVGGTVGAIVTLISLCVFYNRKKQLNKQKIFPENNSTYKQSIKQQYKLARILALFSFLDFALVAIPNLLAILSTTTDLIPNVGGWMLQIICFRGSMNLFIYFLVNNEFRRAILKAMGCRLGNSVTPTHF